jgi:superfamily II DNA helicase RecQ
MSTAVTAPQDALWDTLENLLAPGRRVRLSPFVETAQCAVLLGTRPDDGRRAESIRALLATEGHDATIRRLARHWMGFADGGKDFAHNDYSERDFLDAYLAYYFSVNVPKIQLILLDLARDGLLRGDIALLDLGVGTGTTAVATLDFLLAWGHACDLHGQPFPVTGLRLTGLDRSHGSLDHARRVVEAYARALQERLAARPTAATDPARGDEILRRVHGWATVAVWRVHDLEDAVPILAERPNLIVGANVWNELREAGRGHFDALLHALPTEGIGIVVEPGEQRRAEALMRWRRQFLGSAAGLVALAPCGQEFGDALPVTCANCWNMRAESFHQHPLYRAFRAACVGQRPDGGRAFDQFENRLLSWSYVVVGRGAVSRDVALSKPLPLGDGMRVDGALPLRYLGSYRRRRGVVAPVDYGPDTFRSGSDKDTAPWVESLKLCPAGQDMGKVVLKREPGFQVPPLRYGEPFTVTDVRVRRQDDAYILVPQPGDQTTIRRAHGQGAGGFLPPYDPAAEHVAREAIDEIAYRLFGFRALQPFQHTILARVLAGRSILGIAATGGGKSECFILPAMLLPGVTVVVSPLKSLMLDQYDQRIRARYGLDHLATYINGDVPFPERQARLRRLELGHYKLVYFTPEQLERGFVLDSLRRADNRVGVRYLALDEAHCISQWGHDFRASYLNIIRRFNEYGLSPVRIALTATASPDVRADICDELGLEPRGVHDGGDVFIESSNRPELNLIVRVQRTTGAKVDALVDDLRDLVRQNAGNDAPGAAIVFMPHTGGSPDMVAESAPASLQGRSSAGVSRFASYLERQLGSRVAIYHGRMEAGEAKTGDAAGGARLPGDMRGRTRRAEQEAFIVGERPVMVATKGFGMGIDKSNIRLVVHRSPPGNLEAYAQEAGRAGRDREQADVILYYSPDAPQDENGFGQSKTVPSDHDIQTQFLSDRYVRREDVRALRAFLLSLDHRDRETRYFTNDEAIAFFEQYRHEAGPYRWPDFPERQATGRESDDHRQLRDRGHDYEEKTNYLNRILQAVYRLRPAVEGGTGRMIFIDLVQETGAAIRRPQVHDVRAILHSNAYFGRLLRGVGLAPPEMTELLEAGDLFRLATRLELPLHETAALLHDIKAAEGAFDSNGAWRPALLDFARIVTPRRGPAAGKEGLAAWRAYAGASRRANRSTAHQRARKAGRRLVERRDRGQTMWEPETTLDDWFSWSELPSSRGWEVRLGPALLDEHFPRYLDAFIALHDLRRDNDWAAYRRLLTDYVGVDEGGKLVEAGATGRCLRAVLLGYLKTSETIRGESCLSCNRCVPDERFDRYTREERLAVVVRIGQRLEDLLATAETHADTLPDPTLIDALFATLREEQGRGNAVIRYVEGWSGRLLDQQADHRAALWVRLRAMRDGLIAMQPTAFGEDVSRLVGAIVREEAWPLWALLADTHADETLEAQPLVHAARAQLAHHLNLVDEEVQALERLVSFFGMEPGIDVVRAREGYETLRDLHAPDGPRPQRERWQAYQLQIGRLGADASAAEQGYAAVVTTWSWQDILSELAHIGEIFQESASAAVGLLCAWIEGDTSREQERFTQAIAYLGEEQEGRSLVERASAQDIRLLLGQSDSRPFRIQPHLVVHFANLLLAAPQLDSWSIRKDIQLGVAALAVGEAVAAHVVAFINTAIVRNDRSASFIRESLRPYHDDLGRAGAMLQALSAVLTTLSGDQLTRWLGVFSDSVLDAAPPETGRVLLGQVGLDNVPEAALSPLKRLLTPAASASGDQLWSHQCWLTICRRYPRHLVAYVRDCLDGPAPRTEWADDAFSLVLKTGDVEAITHLLESCGDGAAFALPPRLQHAATFHHIMRERVGPIPGLRGGAITREDFLALRRGFVPWSAVERADMFVDVLQVLRERSNPNWLTPVEFEAEALCDARRLNEALLLDSTHPGLKIGPQRQPLGERIALLRQRGVDRDGSPYADDCRRILRVCFMGATG